VPTNETKPGKFKIRLCAACGYRESMDGLDRCESCHEEEVARQWREERIVEKYAPKKETE